MNKHPYDKPEFGILFGCMWAYHSAVAGFLCLLTSIGVAGFRVAADQPFLFPLGKVAIGSVLLGLIIALLQREEIRAQSR